MNKGLKWTYGLVTLPLIVLLVLIAIRYSEVITMPMEVEPSFTSMASPYANKSGSLTISLLGFDCIYSYFDNI
ncbi:hypothetical protein NOK94_09175 [Streptococcus parasuis]|nr:hypothetical protein [Streptococcus parasuis]MDG4478875.1 hypothetical protein [Streptococcus parasuis]